MARGISISMGEDSPISLPVTDASVSYKQNVISEPSITGVGNDDLRWGNITDIQGSFSGAFRGTFVSFLQDMIESPIQSPKTFVIMDESGSGFTVVDGYLTTANISVKAGEYVKISCEFTGRDVFKGGSVDLPSFTDSITPFYMIGHSDYTALSIKIERPYAADMYVMGYTSDHGHKSSKYIHQAGDMKISGSVTLSQRVANPDIESYRNINMVCNGGTITVRGCHINANEISINGRGLINKTYQWVAESASISIT